MNGAEQGRRGPLAGVTVVDVSALGPGPFASMMLADFGADVISIRRPGPPSVFDPSEGMKRGKTGRDIDLKDPEGVAEIRRLVAGADVFLESARPGVMERLGLGPEVLMADNPRLVYARVTGWGQDGPYAQRAGHDLNYLAVSGALGVSGLERPVVPPALFGDIGNGSYLAAFGVVAALLDRAQTGKGQIVDAAICDGAAFAMAGIFCEMKSGMFGGSLGTHALSGDAPFYRTYRCADGKWFSVGAIEPKFYAALLDILGLDDVDRSPRGQWRQEDWPGLRGRLDALFASRTRDEWTAIFAEVDACTAPVLDVDELAADPHIRARGTVFRDKDGSLHAAPAPRFSTYPLSNAAGASATSSPEPDERG